MNGFSKCPSCGSFDNRRTTCGCGYAVPTAAAEARSTPPPLPSGKRSKFLGNAVTIIVWTSLCAAGVYFFPLGSRSERSSQRDLSGVLKLGEQRQQEELASSQRKNRDTLVRLNSQLRRLRAVDSERTAATALAEAEPSILLAVQMKLLVARLPKKELPSAEKLADQLLVVGDKRAPNATAVAETAQELAAELRRLAARYPETFDAVAKKHLAANRSLYPSSPEPAVLPRN